MTPPITPSQTIGPFFAIGMTWEDGALAVAEGTPGTIRISGQVYDGSGQFVPDAIVEAWQADPDGRFDHPDDPRGPAQWPGFRGFARASTDERGAWAISTLKPGPLPGPGGAMQAPHIDLSVFARGLLVRLVTRIYFADEPGANATDPVLATVDPARVPTLVAAAVEDGYRFDIRLQGDEETVFFAV